MTNVPVVPKVLTRDEILNRMVNIASFQRYVSDVLFFDPKPSHDGLSGDLDELNRYLKYSFVDYANRLEEVNRE